MAGQDAPTITVEIELPTVTRPLFTEREQEIVGFLLKGETNEEISQSIGLAYKTVKNYMMDIYDKLGVHDRTQAAILLMALQREPDPRDENGLRLLTG